MYPQLVLSDDMLKLFLNAKSGKLSCSDFDRIKKLLSFYKPHAICKAQYERIGFSLEANILTELMHSEMAEALVHTGSLKELALKTTFKIILDDKQKEHPYVNIKGKSSIESNFTGTFKGVAKEACIKHLKDLCKSAQSVEIWDRYLYTNKLSPEEADSKCYELLKKISEIVDNERLERFIVYDYNYTCSSIEKSVDQIKVNVHGSHILRKPVNATEKNYHDRYIRITSSVNVLEILLSSGFDNLFEDDKDFTYVVRVIR